MIIKHKLADGQIVDVDVSREVSEVLAKFDRKERSWNRKARRRKVLSLDALKENTAVEAVDTAMDTQEIYIKAEQSKSFMIRWRSCGEQSCICL